MKFTKKKVTALIMAICILLTTVITVRHTGIKSEASSTSTIKEYQRYLNNNYGANLKVDGYYGCQSAKATVVALQKIYNKVYGAGLDVDGYCGPKTQAAMDKYVVKKGTNNELVKFFQKTYNCLYIGGLEVDGKFGNATEKAIKKMYENETTVLVGCSYEGINGEVLMCMLWCRVCGSFYECKASGI